MGKIKSNFDEMELFEAKVNAAEIRGMKAELSQTRNQGKYLAKRNEIETLFHYYFRSERRDQPSIALRKLQEYEGIKDNPQLKSEYKAFFSELKVYLRDRERLLRKQYKENKEREKEVKRAYAKQPGKMKGALKQLKREEKELDYTSKLIKSYKTEFKKAGIKYS